MARGGWLLRPGLGKARNPSGRLDETSQAERSPCETRRTEYRRVTGSLSKSGEKDSLGDRAKISMRADPGETPLEKVGADREVQFGGLRVAVAVEFGASN